MSIYKRRSNGKRSKLFTAEFWYRRQLFRKSGFPDRESAKHWVLSESLKLRRGDVGFIKPMLRHQVAPLVVEYFDFLTAKNRDEKYCYVAQKRLDKLVGDCGWTVLGNVTPQSMEKWLAEPHEYKGKPASNKTLNQYADLAQQFGDWLVKPRGLLPVNPLAGVNRLHEQVNENYRRSGTVDELDKLLAHAPAHRRLFYRFLIYCPLRMGTIERLTWEMIHLDATPPYIEIPASLNKSRKLEKSLLRYDVAQELRNAKRKHRAKADERVFNPFPTIDDWRDDLKAAGVAFDHRGQHRFDRHALRRTLVRLCEIGNVGEGMATLVLHHKDSRTTKKYYGINRADALVADALEKLPTVGKLKKAT